MLTSSNDSGSRRPVVAAHRSTGRKKLRAAEWRDRPRRRPGPAHRRAGGRAGLETIALPSAAVGGDGPAALAAAEQGEPGRLHVGHGRRRGG